MVGADGSAGVRALSMLLVYLDWLIQSHDNFVTHENKFAIIQKLVL